MKSKILHNYYLMLTFMLLIYLNNFKVHGQSKPDNFDRDNTFILGFTDNVFYNINPRDLLAATEVLTKEVLENVSKKYGSLTTIYYDINSLKKDLDRSFVDVIIMSTDEYYQVRDYASLKPRSIGGFGTYLNDELVLLVHNDSKLNTLEDLKSMRLLKLSKGRGNIETMWMNTLLLKNKLGTLNNFFSEVRTREAASQIIIPVFLKQIDACITSKATFETMNQLNPQIGKSLKIISISEPFVSGIVCVNHNKYNDEEEIDLINSTLDNLKNYSAGNQIMKLFKIGDLVKFDADLLKPVFKLIEEYNALSKSVNNYEKK